MEIVASPKRKVKSAILSDRGEDWWNFPPNVTKAEVSFSKSFIQLLFAGFRTQRICDERLACEKSLADMGVLGCSSGQEAVS